MEEELTLAALRMALSRRVVEAGLVHHSDRLALLLQQDTQHMSLDLVQRSHFRLIITHSMSL